MKKFHLKPKKIWKSKKRHSFHLYFILFATIIVTVSTTFPSAVYAIIHQVTGKSSTFPEIIIVTVSSLLVGAVLSFFIGKILLAPIKKLQNMMGEVANGNFDVHIEEKHYFDEVEDMYHYFNVMVKELKATETIQTDFISNVSHEFKTPLNAIEGYATLLSDKTISNEEKDLYTDKILFNLRRMNQLVHNVLLLSRVDNHSIEKKVNKFLLDEQIRQSILFLESKWMEKNIEFDVDFETINYIGNEALLSHVWNNLISNAIKFSPTNGVIRMRLRQDKNWNIFIIEDDGPGVNEEAKKYIFNKFYQADTSHKEEGYGLGLALVKRIIDIENGHVEVENLYHKGCRFVVYLPKDR